MNSPTLPRKLVLMNRQAPGDILMLTALVRDLKMMVPSIQLQVETTAMQLWENNPYIVHDKFNDQDTSVQKLKVGYASLLGAVNNMPGHFVGSFHRTIARQLGLNSIPINHFHGDIHLAEWEREEPRQVPGEDPYWVIICGGKDDMTCKWWNPEHAQKVVDHFKGKINFVQCGLHKPGHRQWPLNGVTDFINKTDVRQFIRVVHRAQGVICPITFAMHAAAALPGLNGEIKPCVVIAGAREPIHWVQYPGHRVLSNIGGLSCCQAGGCWRVRCQTIGDGRTYDKHRLCDSPIQISDTVRIPQCMQNITDTHVIEAVDSYFRNGRLSYL